jgi:hypothetical protein
VHAQYVRIWFVGGLVALVLALPMMLARIPAHATMLVVGVTFLGLSVSLGLLPAFARRDWPSPLYALPSLALAALALPFLAQERAFAALMGASLVVGAAQPLALLLSPRWTTPREPDAHASTDRVALIGIALALAATLVGGLLLVALPRGLPNAAFAVLLGGAAVPAAFSALLFVLPRKSGEPLKAATLAAGALFFLALAAGALAIAFARPFAADFRGPVAATAVGLGLATMTVLRAPSRPALAASALATAVLAALALLLGTLSFDLLPLALYAFLAFALVAIACALVAAAPLLLPGRIRGARWMKWAPALLIAALFLYTPALQLGRSAAPAAIVAAAGVAALVWGLAPLARARR